MSRPNLASGTANDPQQGLVSEYNARVRASFWMDGSPGMIDMAGLTISNFNGSGVLEAYNLNNLDNYSLFSQATIVAFVIFSKKSKSNQQRHG